MKAILKSVNFFLELYHDKFSKTYLFLGGVKHSLSIAGATFAILTLSSAANAATVVIDFTDNTGSVSTFQETAGTATATFSNPSPVNFDCLVGGLVFGDGRTTSFDVSFDQDVELLSYISVLDFGTINFDITGPGVSSLGNIQTSSDFVGQPLLFQAGETYTFTGNTTNNADGTVFGSWTINDAPVSQSVPEPSSILGLLSLGGLAIKKVSKSSNKK